MALTTRTTDLTLEQLVQGIRAIVSSGQEPAVTAQRVAMALQPYLGTSQLLTEAQRESDPTRYRQHILHVEPDGSFSIVALVWLPGQETPIHDHISWCVVGVHEGQEFETTYRLESVDETAHLIETGSTVNPTGMVAALTPPGDIHKVANGWTGLAISLHIYGADIGKLGSSIRRRYDLPVQRPT